MGSNGKALPVPEGQLPNAGMRLFGGAQFHRAMAEFRLAVGGIQVRVWKCGGVDDECALCVSQGFGM